MSGTCSRSHRVPQRGVAPPYPRLPRGRLAKHRVYGIGPEVSLPLATKKKLIGFLDVRYFWETGARTTLEGNTFTFTLTFPIPSVALQ